MGAFTKPCKSTSICSHFGDSLMTNWKSPSSLHFPRGLSVFPIHSFLLYSAAARIGRWRDGMYGATFSGSLPSRAAHVRPLPVPARPPPALCRSISNGLNHPGGQVTVASTPFADVRRPTANRREKLLLSPKPSFAMKRHMCQMFSGFFRRLIRGAAYQDAAVANVHIHACVTFLGCESPK